MRKGLFIILLCFLLVLSACGNDNNITLPDPTSVSIESPDENIVTEDNATIQQLMDVINSSDGFSAEFNENTQNFKITCDMGLDLDSYVNAMIMVPEEYYEFVEGMQELALSTYNRIQSSGLTEVSVSTYIYASGGQPFLTFENDKKQIDIVSSLIKNYEEQQRIEENNVTSLYSDNYIDIEYSHCSESDSFNYTGEYSVFLIVNNKTSQSIIVTENSLAVDGWNLSDADAYQQIAANSKGYVEVTTTELPTLTPSTISGSLELYDETDQAWGSRTYDATFTNIEIG